MSRVRPKRRNIFLALLGVILLALIFTNLPDNGGPIQNGKTLDEWLTVLYQGMYQSGAVNTEPAQAAVKALGTNAVPHLVRRIAEGKDRTGPVVWLIVRVPRLRRIDWLREWVTDNPRRARAEGAAEAFSYLGSAGDSAVDELSRLVNANPPPVAGYAALRALGGIGTTNCLPPLLAAMTHTNAYIRANAAAALGNLKESARPAIPLLIASLEHSNMHLAICAANALGKLKLEPEIVVPALIKGLADPRPDVRFVTIISLQHLGPLARPAVPALLELAGASDPQTRDSARNALQQIAPEVLTNAPAE
jgi:hypothetical protein